MGEAQPRINTGIKAPRMRVILPDKQQMGIVSISEALLKAAELDLDLVEIAPNADPPVCKIMDYGKYRYEASKRERESRKKQSRVTVKEIKLRPKTEDHDIAYRCKQIMGFLGEQCKVKVTVMFRGRELTHPEQATRLLDKILESVGNAAFVEQPPTREGRNLTLMLAPTAT